MRLRLAILPIGPIAMRDDAHAHELRAT